MKDYRKLFNFAKPYYWRLVSAGIFMAIVTGFDMFRLSGVVPVIDRIFTDKSIVFSGIKPPVFIERILNQLNAFAPLEVLYLILLAMGAACVVRAVFDFLQSYIMSDVGQKVVRDVRKLVYEKLQTLSLDYFTQKRSGELVSRVTNDVKLVENAVSYALTDLICQSFQMVSLAVLTFIINWRLALISVITFPLVAMPMLKVGKVLRKLSKRSQEKMADINSLLVETFIGMRIIKAFCAEEKEAAKFTKQNFQYYKLSMKSIKRMLLLGIFTELIGVGMALFVLYYGAKLVFAKVISFGVFTFFMATLLSLIKPFKKLSQVNSIMQQAVAASSRIYEVLETVPSVRERPNAAVLSEFKEKIVFDNVWFSYQKDEILKGVNLEVKRGELLAIVGPSGMGKTTLVDLLPRFYDPIRGRILIDGLDIKEVSLGSLRQQIGIVTQETILFNDTIRANIAYGNSNANDLTVEEAAALSYAHNFIKGLAQGYDTVIGDRGMKLSGGERQRIAIARALLKNPPILILDEATSQLDSQAERIVQEALDRLMKGRTVFVIAHRLSTVSAAQRIVVLEKGMIVEDGGHSALLNNNGLYKRLYEMQELQK